MHYGIIIDRTARDEKRHPNSQRSAFLLRVGFELRQRDFVPDIMGVPTMAPYDSELAAGESFPEPPASQQGAWVNSPGSGNAIEAADPAGVRSRVLSGNVIS